MKKALALASVAGSLVTILSAQAQVAVPAMPPASVSAAQPSTKPIEVRPDEKDQSPDLRQVQSRSGQVFDGVLVRKTTTTPPGMRVLVTEYVFEVHEWFQGADGTRTVTVRETGGVDADGSGLCTANSHKLILDGRYLVFLRPEAGQLLFPFDRVLNIMDTGATVADETGRVLVGLNGAVPVVRGTPEVPSMSYLGTPATAQGPTEVGPPTPDFAPAQPVVATPSRERAPIPAEQVFKILRAKGARPPAEPGPAGLNSAALGGADWNYCGYVTGATGAHNYACWLPDNNNFAWFNDAAFYWNQDVIYGGGGWIFGFLTSGGNPIRNELPVANNNRDNGAVPSDAMMIAGGYGSWAANANPNGICFIWFTGASCTRIRETDTFINPSNGANELQFRKSMTHEMGHAIGLGHEDRYVANMVSGTWRVVPNYFFNDYLRMDDRLGARWMMIAANGNGGVWNLANYRDITTSGQSHPNAGSAGDIGPNVTQLSTYNANVGGSVTISRLHVENRGRVGYGGPVTLNIYLSTDPFISSGDTLVWSGGWGSFGNETYATNFSEVFTVPNVPTGTYYVGWIVSSPEGELTNANNTALMTYDSSGGFAARTIAITNSIPANDACGNATTVGVGTYSGSNVFATTDGSGSCGFNDGKDVWYRFTAPCTGTLTVDSCGSNFDTVVSVHGGCPGTGANILACNDDDCFCGGAPCRQSLTSLAVAGGSTYLIRMAGYNSASGSYTLHVGFAAAAPGNDSCSSATLIGDGTYTGSTICANIDGGADCGASTVSPDVWYQYQAPADGALHVDTCGSPYDTVLSVHTDCPGTIANELGCNDDYCGFQSSVDVPVIGGQFYYIRVSGYNGSYGNFTLHAGFTPVNNDCSSAIAIGDGVTPFTNVGATTDGPTESLCSFCCGDFQVNQDIWYVYTATCNGTVGVSLCGSDFDTKIAVYAGSDCPSPNSPDTAIACNDDFCDLQSETSFAATAGSVYLIRVGGYLTNTGSGTITISCTPDPVACYPNCDNSTTSPCLNVLDFSCFLNAFAAGDPYANCDGSTTPPVLNVLDFSCFLNQFAAGCSGC